MDLPPIFMEKNIFGLFVFLPRVDYAEILTKTL